MTNESRRRRRRRQRPVSRRSLLEHGDNPLLQSSWYIKNRNITCLSSSFVALSVLAASHPTMTRFVGVLTRHQSRFFISAIFDYLSIDKSIETLVHALETNVLEKSVVAIARDADRSTLIQRLQYGGPISRFVHLDVSWRYQFRSSFVVSKLDLLRILSWNVSRISRNIVLRKMECKSGNVMKPIWFFEEVECCQSSIFSMQRFTESLVIDL